MAGERVAVARATDGTLVEGCLRGSEAAVAEIYGRYHDRLVGFFVLRTGDPHLAQDLAHDAWLRFQAALGGFDRSRPVWPYLKMIAGNLLTDHHRRGWLEVPDALGTDGRRHDEAVLPEHAEVVTLQALIDAAMATLPQRQAMALRLVHDHGLRGTEAASHMGVSASAFRQLALRARRRLRCALESAGLSQRLGLVAFAIGIRRRTRSAVSELRRAAQTGHQIALRLVDHATAGGSVAIVGSIAVVVLVSGTTASGGAVDAAGSGAAAAVSGMQSAGPAMTMDAPLFDGYGELHGEEATLRSRPGSTLVQARAGSDMSEDAWTVDGQAQAAVDSPAGEIEVAVGGQGVSVPCGGSYQATCGLLGEISDSEPSVGPDRSIHRVGGVDAAGHRSP